MRKWKWIHAIYGALFLLSLLLAISKVDNDANRSAHALRANAISFTQGQIVARDLWDHARMDYKYTVGDKTYTAMANYVTPEAKVGQSVGVHFNPTAPTESYTDEEPVLQPETTLTGAFWKNVYPFLILLAIALPIRLLIWFVRRRKNLHIASS